METELLSHARLLIDWIAAGGNPLDSPGATILVSDVAAGADGVNRNFLADGAPSWSWRTIGTPSFADFTIEILDGWPTFVESDVEGWIANTNGQIGFWGYTVVAELGPLIEGDFDLDGDVDGADFQEWQRGESPDPFSVSDLADWEFNYGTTATSIATDGLSVPEPSAWRLLLPGIAPLLFAMRAALPKSRRPVGIS